MKIYELTYQKNIRDLGGLLGFNGHKIKPERIYRGGSLHKVTNEDVNTVNSFHLTDIIDFRSSEEYNNRPDYRFKGVKYHNLTTFEYEGKKEDKNYEDGNLLWFIDKGNDGHKHLKKTYVDLVSSSEGQKAYRDMFKILMKDDKRVVYFHCSQGKDRAGLAAYFIEKALGVSDEDILNDYLISNVAMEKRTQALIDSVKDKPFYDEQYHQSLLDVFSAKEEYLNDAINYINDKYGNVENYLKEILKVDIQKFRSIYLEK